MQVNEDDLPSQWLPNAWACFMVFITVTLHILFHLLCTWSLRWKTLTTA